MVADTRLWSRRTSACCVVLMAIAHVGCAQPRTVEVVAEIDPAAPVRQAISLAWDAHIQAAVVKDLEAVMAIYHEDIVYSVPDTEARGFDDMQGVEATALATADVLEAQHTTDALQVVGDVAYELGTIAGPVRALGQEPVVVSFHFMAQWQRGSDERWRLKQLVGAPTGEP